MEEGRQRPSIVKPIVIVAGMIIILAAIKAAAAILGMFFLAVFLAISFTPAFARLRSKGVPNGLAVLILFVVIIGFALLLFGLAWFPLSRLDDKIPVYQTNLSGQIASAQNLLEGLGVDVSRFEEEGLFEIGKVLRFLAAVILTITNTMFLLLVVVLTAVFMMLEASSYPDRLRSGLGVSNTVIDHYRSFARSVNSYLLTRIKLNLALAVPVTIMLFILGVDFPILWGVVTFFAGFIPVVGFLLAIFPPASLALMESGWVYAVIVIAGFTIINVIVDNVIQPRLMGQDLNLSPVVVFLSLFLWSFLLGGIGMLLAMPLTVLIVLLFAQFRETRWLAILMSSKPIPELGADPAKIEPELAEVSPATASADPPG